MNTNLPVYSWINTDPTASRSVFERFQDVANSFGKVLLEIQSSSARRANESYAAFASALSVINEESRNKFQEIFAALQTATREGTSKADPASYDLQVYRNYLDSLSRAHEEVQKRYHDAIQLCISSLHKTQEDARGECLEAYRRYLQSLKDTWANLDVNALMSAAIPAVQAY